MSLAPASASVLSPSLPPGVVIGRCGLTLPDNLSPRDYAQIAPVFMAAQRAVQWCLGDYVVFGEKKYGKTYDELAKLTGYEIQTLMNFASVARSVEISRRRENLPYTTHAEVAGLPVEQQEWHLNQADIAGLSVAEVRMAVRRQREENEQRATQTRREQHDTTHTTPAQIIIEQDAEPRRGGYQTGEPDRPSGYVPTERIGRGLEVGERNEAMLAQVRRTPVIPEWETVPLPGEVVEIARALMERHNKSNPKAAYSLLREYIEALIRREAAKAGVG